MTEEETRESRERRIVGGAIEGEAEGVKHFFIPARGEARGAVLFLPGVLADRADSAGNMRAFAE
jgi:hypothetical protein